MRKKLFLSVCLCFFLCGCSGYKEIDMRYMVSAIGFSYSGEYTVFAETVSIGTDNTTATPRIFKGEGENPEKAFENLKKSFSKGMMLEHCAAVIFESSMEEEKIKNALDYFINLNGVNMSACTAKSSDIQKLLSSESETAAVGYDIYLIEKRQETLKESRLVNILSGKIKFPVFENRDNSATQTEGGR